MFLEAREDMRSAKKSDEPRMLILIFAACFFYWTYLIFNTTMFIKFDATHYEDLGRMIYQKGWSEYFRTGPNREPLYPFVVSVSMRLADIFSIPYQVFQKVFQACFVFLTQILLWVLMKQLRIDKKIRFMILLFFGFSPVMLNSMCSLYSEAMMIPWAIGIVLCLAKSYRIIHNGMSDKAHQAKNKKDAGYLILFLYGVLTAFLLLVATSGKGIFEYLFIFYLMPFLLLAGFAWIRSQKKVFCYSLFYVLITGLVYQSTIAAFKSLNDKYNGHYELTNRYSELFFANALKRTEKLSPRMWMAHLASIPGRGVCQKFFTQQECEFTGFEGADQHRIYLVEHIQGVPSEKINAQTIALTFGLIRAHPIQYAILSGIESFKMIFWETTQLGFVGYPDYLQKLFSNSLLKDGLRFLMSFLTGWAIVYVVGYLYRHRLSLVKPASQKDGQLKEIQTLFFVVLVIVPFIGLYAMFSILTRFALPIVSLFLVCIAFLLDGSMKKCLSRGN